MILRTCATAILIPFTLGWIPNQNFVTRLPSKPGVSLTAKRGSVSDSTTKSDAKPVSFLPWAKESGMGDQVQLLEKSESGNGEEMEGMSPELIGAGAVAAAITVIAGLSTAANFDVR